MKLIACHIDNFGIFHDFDMEFEDSLNVIIRDNGWGKTTLAAFIRAMLYGYDNSRKKDITENDRKRYLPWQGGTYGGTLTFEKGGTRYLVSRTFGVTARHDTMTLRNLDAGKSVPGVEQVGEWLFKLDGDAFKRSAYITQNTLNAGGSALSFHARLNAILGEASDVGAYDQALKTLTARMKYYEKTGNRGYIGDIQRKAEELLALQRQARDRISQVEGMRRRITELDAELKQKDGEVAVLKERVHAEESRRKEQEAAGRLYQELKSRKQEADLEQEAFLEQGAVPDEEELRILEQGQREISRISEGLKLLTEQRGKEQQALEEEQKALEEKYTLLEQRLRQLEGRYGGCLPEEEEITGLLQIQTELAEALAAQRAASGVDAEIRGEQAKLEGIESAIRQLDTAGQVSDLGSEAPKPAAAVGAIGGAALAVLLGIMAAPVFFGLAVLLAAGGMVLFMDNRKKRALFAERKKAFEEEKDQARKRKAALEGERAQTLASLLEKEARAAALQSGASPQELKARLDQGMELLAADTRGQSLEQRTAGALADREALGRLKAELHEQSSQAAEGQRRLELYRKEIPFGQKELQRQLTELTEEIHGIQDKYKITEEIPQWISEARERRETAARLRQRQAAAAGQLADFEKEHKDQLERSCPVDSSSAQQLERCEQQRESLMRERARMEDGISHADEMLESYPRILQKLKALGEEKQKADKSLYVLKKSIELLKKARENLSSRYLGQIEANFNRYLSQWAGKEDLKGILDTDFNITMEQNGTERAAEGYSTGYVDMMDFCMRMALIDTLYEEERPFIIMDDPFVSLDEEHLNHAMSLLKAMSADSQILYFVCHPVRAAEPSEGAARIHRRKLIRPEVKKAEPDKAVKRERYLLVPGSGVEPVGHKRRITNNIFSLEFKPDEGLTAAREFEVFFTDEKERVICDKQQIWVKEGEALPSRLRFCLNTGNASGSTYTLMIRDLSADEHEMVKKIPFEASLTFTSDFDF